MNTKAKIAGGFLLGATVGVAAGLLLAPKSGKKMRKEIADESMKFAEHLADKISASLDTLKDKYNKQVDVVAQRGQESIDQVKDVLKA